jgi:hypothetical protein
MIDQGVIDDLYQRRMAWHFDFEHIFAGKS